MICVECPAPPASTWDPVTPGPDRGAAVRVEMPGHGHDERDTIRIFLQYKTIYLFYYFEKKQYQKNNNLSV